MRITHVAGDGERPSVRRTETTMAKEKKVEQITDMETNFAQWYTDICRKAELVEYASVKGFTILRPYGYAIWENMQQIMDGEFKKTGHMNVAMPVLIPESLLKKEGELVNGFAPEVAWVTMGGSEQLEERLAFRPTSETMFCDHWSRVLHSYRELPMLYNQWCSVIRWEKTTRPFLRSREFWWQEGHTAHATAEESRERTIRMLNVYADFCEEFLAIPVIRGQKTDKEKFAGAIETYTSLIGFDGDNAQAYFLRGSALIGGGEAEAGLDDYHKAVQVSDGDYELHMEIYENLIATGHASWAAEFLNLALEIEGDSAENYLNRGRIYIILDQYEVAKTTLQKAVDKGSADAKVYLAQVYDYQGDEATAKQLLDEYVSAPGVTGESLVTAQEGTRVKVHVHTTHPGDVIALAQRYGE